MTIALLVMSPFAALGLAVLVWAAWHLPSWWRESAPDEHAPPADEHAPPALEFGSFWSFHSTRSPTDATGRWDDPISSFNATQFYPPITEHECDLAAAAADRTAEEQRAYEATLDAWM